MLAVPCAHAHAAAVAEKVSIHRELADIYEKTGKWDNAVSEYGALLALNSKDADAETSLGLCFERKNEFARAIQHLRNAVKIDPSAQRYKALGDVLFWIKDYRAAVEAYRKAGISTPNHGVGDFDQRQQTIDQLKYNREFRGN
jgi:tetratricopeptide (TPR) repeat protein